MMNTKAHLAEIAMEKALTPYHGTVNQKETNLQPIGSLFPKWSLPGAERLWCAAFVYYCCVEAGFDIPYSPAECCTCSLAGCGGWEEFALGDQRIIYCRDRTSPEIGDIVLYDYVFCNKQHDHMGIVTDIAEGYITCAEGNIGARIAPASLRAR